jgi:hypothetical protein
MGDGTFCEYHQELVKSVSDINSAVARIEGRLENGLGARLSRLESRIDQALNALPSDAGGSFMQKHGAKVGSAGVGAGIIAVILEIPKIIEAIKMLGARP